jgi:hypothetical protein
MSLKTFWINTSLYKASTPLIPPSKTRGEFHDATLTDGSTRFVTWPMSTWLYNAANHDSKKEVVIEIRKRRAQKIKAAAEAAPIRARQATVDLRADAARPEDAAKMLGERFREKD